MTTLLGDVVREGLELVESALAAGIARQSLIFDPGVGFGKTPVQNIELLRDLESLREMGLPLLVGVSRKSFIGELTGAASGGSAGRVAGGSGGGGGEGRGHGAGA